MPRILKAPPSSHASDLAAFSFDDLGQPTRSKLDTARQEADEIVAAAREEATHLRQQAEQDGRAAAQREVEQQIAEQVAAKVGPLTMALEKAVTELQAAKADCLARWEQAAIGVAVAIAARVIRREVDRAPQIALSLVRESLELAAGSTELQLYMHPDDVESLGPRVEQLLSQLARCGREALIADPTITRGGCRLDTRAGTIDQQFEAQLARIEQELR